MRELRAEWQQFAKVCCADWPEADIESCRRAFYSGARALSFLMGKSVSERNHVAVTDLEDELAAFATELEENE